MTDLSALLGPDVSRRTEVIHVDAAEFDAAKARQDAMDEAFGDETAFAAVGAVSDGSGRLALVRNDWSDGWVLPGGMAEPGETAVEAATREVREETGLTLTVARPVEVVVQSVRHGDDVVTGSVVVVAGRARTTGLVVGSGVDGETIHDAAWFDAVPAETPQADLVERHLGLD